MHPRHILAFGMGRLDQLHDLFQVQLGTVDHLERLMTFQYGGGHQRAGVDDHRATADQSLAFDGDQFRVAGAGADKVDGHGEVLFRNG
ncbi:hypothetical protein PFLmoz3_03946 [Pseudomonas fluorescens]|uniref:Uncharacterized protein n=1 Tax=Pseudomonas fluorescens TaxID=294 RepID=A0A109LF77_PSEFL|nr:hypothetical protein PFLmoz3_03946 [Pseudomonas fluorescens]